MGYAVGATCYRDEAEAAAFYCAAMSGYTAEGYVHCTSATFGEGGVLTLGMSVESSTGSTTREIAVNPAQCEPHDVERYEPHIAAFVLAVVVLTCLKVIHKRFFSDSQTA